jgi:predicted acetyltransferase
MVESFTWCCHPQDPALLSLSECRWRIAQQERWMLRIVHVQSALSARGYPSTVKSELHLELDDPLLSENSGRYVLWVQDGRGRVERGGRGSLQLSVQSLAPMYTGFCTPAQLRSTGLVQGDDSVIEQASLLFAGPPPHTQDRF